MKKEFYGITQEDEELKLRKVSEVAAAKLETARNMVKSLADELNEQKEVYDADDREGLAQWFNTDSRFQEVRKELLRAERAGRKPYFGRIDFEDEEHDTRETYYIGKSLIAENPAEPIVIDWRTPLASVYYDHTLGKCTYSVPNEGNFTVDLKRKRTYEIEDNRLVRFYDSDVVANDDLLTEYLSKSKKNVLSEIIATIQEEQNDIIRMNPRHNILVQGSAGSGKTTVAMHRISYILYNYETEFKPEGFYIIGGNKVLLNYITGVLPDLDVFGVRQMTMEELFTRLLYEEWDKKMTIRKVDRNSPSVGIKGTAAWFRDVKTFCDHFEWHYLPRTDVIIEKTGNVLVSRDEVDEVIRRFGYMSLCEKLEKLTDILMSHLESELYGKYYSYSPEEQKTLLLKYRQYYKKMQWKGSVFSLYEEFLNSQEERGKHADYVKDEPDIYDLAALAYIYKRFKETEIIQEASHVVIDEAQDFGLMVYSSLKYCMSKCTFTIMGDVSQNISLNAGLSDWEELKKIMLPDKYDRFSILKKSYRNTVEISEFATNILKHGTMPVYPTEPIIRHGDAPRVLKCEDHEELVLKIASVIDGYRAKGLETIAVITKDSDEAGKLCSELSEYEKARTFKGDENDFGEGVMIIPIELSKGLEFDAVIIYNPDKESYPMEDGYAKLLYVAATRALHELSVVYTGELTDLIGTPVPEGNDANVITKDDEHLRPFVFEEDKRTTAEIAKAQAAEGDAELKLREKYGPKRITVEPRRSLMDEILSTMQENADDGKTGKEAATALRPAHKSTVIVSNTPETVKKNEPSAKNAGAAYASKIPASGSRTANTGAGAYASATGTPKPANPYSSVGGIPRAVARKPAASRPTDASAGTSALAALYSGKSGVSASQASMVNRKPYSPDTPDPSKQAQKKQELSGREFGSMPSGSLQAPGHGKIDNGVKWYRNDGKHMEVTCGYGILSIYPVRDDTIRIVFGKEPASVLMPLPGECAYQEGMKWKATENREAIDITLAKLKVHIDKKSGALSFYNKNGQLLMSEKTDVPRQQAQHSWWEYPDFSKKEKLNANGRESFDWPDISGSAQYISHGDTADRPAVIMSNRGYQILIPHGIKLLACIIPVYGPYLCFENSSVIDYVFRTAI